ncbi:CpsB/CapC family capsule biosynthesis tyrosine phosphatase [Butyrivibrio sp. YAB3001]|uniref:CpsB/CapC family capsule biosynthesis tyrosine phosphatase n=1 Tax=Butyrivibrio sp. YAB3001 TaxID=1520812 RepID=UPI0008F6235F|nr:CpsB/CapC family capsule biosynthesis tyrosine phosphatase [Butyrivibrio sp. YAB3001]SFB84816.1 protein-tyrosine phosphatase [Butyrivibrio sp. YAB3001]
MKSSIDIHCHILPGVDDGSPDMESSLKMLQIAKENSVEQIILTPHHKPMHHNVSPEHNKKYTEILQKEAAKAGIEIRLYSGNEIYYSDETQVELEEGKICTLAGSDYVLVEFHPTNPFKAIHNGIYQVQSAGFIPILAHVERYSDIVSHMSYVEDLIKMGCYIQVNASSIMGKYGFWISRFTKKLLKKELVHFIASDAHDTQKRAPNLLDCRNYVTKRFGEEYSDRLFFTNPMNVINNEVM